MSKAKHSQIQPLAAQAVKNNSIVVRGAREHNLRSLDVEIPKRKLVVFTGPSGSGKSSMAFDTIYAEGRRRYVESMSIYARQFLGAIEKPDFDQLTGLSPAISIEQKTTGSSPRSTVGTITEIYDHLRVLYAQLGRLGETDDGPQTFSVGEILDDIVSLPEKTRYLLVSPLVRNRKGEFKSLFEKLRKSGFTRARVDGEITELEGLETVALQKKHNIDVVIDRLVSKGEPTDRLEESLERALDAGEGRCILIVPEQKGHHADERVYTKHSADRDLSHQNFSFNSPVGWCKECRGIGTTPQVAPDLIVLRDTISIREGAIAVIGREPENEAKNFALADEVESIWETLESLESSKQLDLDKPWGKLTDLQREWLIYGTKTKFRGIVDFIRKTRKKARRQAARDFLDEFIEPAVCSGCGGSRLNEESRSVSFKGKTITEISQLNIVDALAWFETLELEGRDAKIGHELLVEVRARLAFLVDVGLGYLNLGRSAETLSGGESQRIRLASQLGSELSGILYILDEPSIGLHQRDNHRLLETLQSLRDRGNSILVVEHDRETMEIADWILDFGPGAGRNGGEIVAQGTPDDITSNEKSITGDYLAGRRKLEVPDTRREGTGEDFWIRGARHHNLKNIDARIPLGTFTCVTGVSGAGKSSLINEILYPAVARHVFFKHRSIGECDSIEGLEHFDKVIEIDQSPIGRTPRSNPATYTKVFDHIRELFANLPESRMYGFDRGRFSFNVAGGRCEECKGAGLKKIEMNFLADVYVPCDLCHGKRFNHTTLMVRYRSKTIADVLQMTVAEAAEFFAAVPKVSRILQTLLDVGLDYVQLGQPSTTLSGGEAQRVKLSRELAKIATGNTLYILDEPSTGLHFEDIRKLLAVIDQLVDAGNTVVMIEHNLDIIKYADWILDLGPEGGVAGGELIAMGTPEEVSRVAESHTGRFLARELEET